MVNCCAETQDEYSLSRGFQQAIGTCCTCCFSSIVGSYLANEIWKRMDVCLWSVSRGCCNFFERNYSDSFSLAPPPAAGWREEGGDTPYPAKGPWAPWNPLLNRYL